MPAISKIDLTNGIEIVGSSLSSRELLLSSFPNVGSIKIRENVINQYFQSAYETRVPLNKFHPSEPQRQKPPILQIKERIVGNELITTTMFIKVDILSISPLRYTITCSDLPISSLQPIECHSYISGNMSIS